MIGARRARRRSAFPVGAQTVRRIGLEPGERGRRTKPPQGEMHLVHVEDPPGHGRPGAHIEQAEEPARLKRGQDEFGMIAQTIVEGEEYAARGRRRLSSSEQNPRGRRSRSYPRNRRAGARSRRGSDRENTADRPPPAAHNDTSPASRPALHHRHSKAKAQHGFHKVRLVHWTKMLLSVPTPSIDTSTVFVGFFIVPTPIDVPQAIISPGSSVMSCESRLTSLAGGKIMSVTG